MRDIPYDSGDKEVLESIIWPRVQQFLAWRRESESSESPLNLPLRVWRQENPVFSDGLRR
jgi:hypothetical protein